MNIKKTFLYKNCIEKYRDYKIKYRIEAHEREISNLRRSIEVHEAVLDTLSKRPKGWE